MPDPIYKLDFENASTVADFGGVQHGDGALVTSSDARFGKYYQNRPNATTSETTTTENYLEVVPATNFWATLLGNSQPISFTLSMWVNAEVAETLGMNCFLSSLFTGYTAAGVSESRTWYYPVGPDVRYAGQFHLNNAGYADETEQKKIDGWASDKQWHHIACVFSNIGNWNTFSITWYLDGTNKGQVSYMVNDGNSNGMFTNLDRFVIGGASPIWADPDNAFAYDDIAIYDYALTDAQVNQVFADKIIQGTQIGAINYSTGSLAAKSTLMKLYPGDKYHYRFINYTQGVNNWKNWQLLVQNQSGTNKIQIRADWYDEINGSSVAEHQRGFSSNAANYWAIVPSKMNGCTVDMEVTFTEDKKLEMTSTSTSADGNTTWTYNYTSDNANNVDLSGDYVQVAISVYNSWLDLLSENYSAIGAKIGGNGYTTFANANALDLASLPSGLKAYKAKINGSVVKFTEVNEAVPANTGLLLEGTTDETYSIPVAASASALADNDFFVNETGNTFSPDANTTYFGLIKNSSPLTFGVFAPATVAIPANKAYLKVADTAARELVASFDDDVTSIETVKTQNKIDGVYYNLAGQRVVAPVKGLYIVNGKKCIIK